MASNVIGRAQLMIFAVALLFSAVAEEGSMTVKMESFMETVAKGIAGLDSKMDSLLRTRGNTQTSAQSLETEWEHRISSLSFRIINMENEIDAMKSSTTGYSFVNSSKSSSESEIDAMKSSTTGYSFVDSSKSSSDGNVLDRISNLESKIAVIQGSLESEKSLTNTLEQRIQELIDTVSSLSVDKGSGSGDQSCNLKNVKEGNLVDVNSNIFAWKPANASSTQTIASRHQVTSAFDGDFGSYFFSTKELNPWLFVDLQNSHFIFEIRVTAGDASRTGGLTVYLSQDAAAFFKHGKLDVDSGEAQMFGHQVAKSDNRTVTFKRPDGMCGRYMLLYRAVLKDYLIIREIDGTGYVFD